MIPLRDSLKPTKTPFVNYLIIAANLLVFLIELAVPDLETFIRTWGLVPAAVGFSDASSLLRFVSSMFLHAGWIHIGANMLFLHVFGDMVESRLGHLRFLLWYLSWGVAAAISQYIFDPTSTMPILGASGAVAGIMGAYFVFFKHSTVETLLPTFGGFMTVVEIPAPLMLLYWFIIQLFSGSASIVGGGAALGGVAWFAHVGGFTAGWLTARRLKGSGSEEPIAIDW
jgi:membrane associated rhomboid family serine protease